MTIWTWDSREQVFEAGEPEGALWAADSWFVSDCRVRAFDRHRRRLNASARELGFCEPSSEDFWAALIDLIPPSGEWFSRVEIIGGSDPALGFRLRPSLPRTDELRLWTPPFSDPRQNPHVKGPDIGMLENLRARARADQNCDEVLLNDEQGFAVESTTSSLLWWDDRTLCVPRYLLSSPNIPQDRRGRWPEIPGMIHAPSHPWSGGVVTGNRRHQGNR